MSRGLFISFEGGDGSGKSTQIRLLSGRLRRRKVPVTVVREPGGTLLGDRLRRILKFSSFPLTPAAELLLFNASRAQLVSQVVRPALEEGRVVVCDRFTGSTLAYQGCGRGIPLARVRSANRVATGGLTPRLTVLLDVPPETGLLRRPDAMDRFERGFEDQEVVAFHHRVHSGYLELARQDPNRWFVVDASLPAREVARLIWERVEPLIRNVGAPQTWP